MTSDEPSTRRQETLSLLLKQGVSSAASLSSKLGISVQAMRRHLRSLEKDGLVAAGVLSIGAGRPSNMWKLTIEGENYFNNAACSEKWLQEIFESMKATLPPDSMAELLNNQGLNKASRYRQQIGSGSINTRLKKLVELRNKEGYLAELHQENDGESTWYINAFHCSIHAIAEQHPVVCEQELALIQDIFPDCNVQRVQWRLESGHSCAYQITSQHY